MLFKLIGDESLDLIGDALTLIFHTSSIRLCLVTTLLDNGSYDLSRILL